MTRRFDGLRIVPDPDEGPAVDPADVDRARIAIAGQLQELGALVKVKGTNVTDPVGYVVAVVGEDSAMVRWFGLTNDDVRDACGVTTVALGAARRGDDIDGRVSRDRASRVAYREKLDADRRQDELDYPWVCDCRRRFKTERGLDSHKRACDRRRVDR